MAIEKEALDYLYKLQMAYVKYGGITPLGFKYKYLRKIHFFGELAKEINTPNLISDDIEMRRSEFTFHESSASIHILGGILDDLKKVMMLCRFVFPENVAVGTAQFGKINAFASAPSVDSPLKAIIIDEGLFTFINSFSKIVSMLLPKTKESGDIYSFSYNAPDIDQALRDTPAAHEYFVSLITSYLITGDPAYSQKFRVNDEDDIFVNILRHTAEVFIVAHEYGHILYNHFSKTEFEEEIIADEFNVAVWKINWMKELQADQIATQLVMKLNHHVKDMEAPLSFVGISFFFATIDVLHKALGHTFSETHPSPTYRIQNLIDSFYKDTTDWELVDDMVRLSRAISDIVYLLWEINQEKIMQIIQQFVSDYNQSENEKGMTI